MIRSHRPRSLMSCTGAAALLAVALGACSPTVKVEAPDKPIRIDLNINIQQEVRIKVDRALDDAFAKNPEIFGVTPGGKQ